MGWGKKISSYIPENTVLIKLTTSLQPEVVEPQPPSHVTQGRELDTYFLHFGPTAGCPAECEASPGQRSWRISGRPFLWFWAAWCSRWCSDWVFLSWGPLGRIDTRSSVLGKLITFNSFQIFNSVSTLHYDNYITHITFLRVCHLLFITFLMIEFEFMYFTIYLWTPGRMNMLTMPVLCNKYIKKWFSNPKYLIK